MKSKKEKHSQKIFNEEKTQSDFLFQFVAVRVEFYVLMKELFKIAKRVDFFRPTSCIVSSKKTKETLCLGFGLKEDRNALDMDFLD